MGKKCPECSMNMIQILKDDEFIWSCPYECVYQKKKEIDKMKKEDKSKHYKIFIKTGIFFMETQESNGERLLMYNNDGEIILFKEEKILQRKNI